MPTEVGIRVFGDDVFIRRMQAMRYRARDMSPVLDEIADVWSDIIDNQFQTEGARSGARWNDLERETYLKRGSKHPILIESADMFNSMGRDNIHVSDDTVEMTFPVAEEGVKAAAHQHGFYNVAADRFVEARPIVRFTEADTARFRRMISDYLFHGDV